MNLNGTSTLVTGASRGLGRALAEQLAAAGARVVAVARHEAELARVVQGIRAAGGEAHALSADVSQKSDVYPLAGAAAALVGPIDLLIHNASALGPTPLRLLLDTECEDLEQVLATNLVGPFRLSKAVAGSMALRKTGTILHVSSDAAVNAYERWGAYGVSKAALDHLSRSWAAELAERGVRVLSVDPGEMDTAMHAAAMPDADRSALLPPRPIATKNPGPAPGSQRHQRQPSGAFELEQTMNAAVTGIEPARAPRGGWHSERLLVLDPLTRRLSDQRIDELPLALGRHDVLVLNDAATLPAALRESPELELRLVSAEADGTFLAVAFGSGDSRSPTETRGAPRRLAEGERLRFTERLAARVVGVDPAEPRLLRLRFETSGAAFCGALYRHAAPIQYSYLAQPLALWDVQNRYASRPWAFELPSAGRPLTFEILFQLERRGVTLAAVTHAAGISSTGSATLDARLPLAERYDIPLTTAHAIDRAREHGGRVVAVGTSVVRALEAASREDGSVTAGSGVTTLRLDRRYEPRVVDGLLSGLHQPGTSHFELLEAFAAGRDLERAATHAAQMGYLQHEFGDSCLVLAGALLDRAAA